MIEYSQSVDQRCCINGNLITLAIQECETAMSDQGNDTLGKTMDAVLFPACAIACDGSLDMFSQRRPQLWRNAVLVSLTSNITPPTPTCTAQGLSLHARWFSFSTESPCALVSDATPQLTGLECALTHVHAVSALNITSSRKPDTLQ